MPDSPFRYRPHAEVRVPGSGDFARDDYVQIEPQAARHVGSDHDPAAGYGENDPDRHRLSEKRPGECLARFGSI